MSGRWGVLDQRAGAQPDEGKAHLNGGAADHRGASAALRLQVDQRRTERADRRADGGALQCPGGEQRPDAVRCQEQPARAPPAARPTAMTRRRPTRTSRTKSLSAPAASPVSVPEPWYSSGSAHRAAASSVVSSSMRASASRRPAVSETTFSSPPSRQAMILPAGSRRMASNDRPVGTFSSLIRVRSWPHGRG